MILAKRNTTSKLPISSTDSKMTGKHGASRRLSRRELLRETAGAGLAIPLLGACNTAHASPRRRDLIRIENDKPGTTGWMLAKTIMD